jgi:hypothetical protein
MIFSKYNDHLITKIYNSNFIKLIFRKIIIFFNLVSPEFKAQTGLHRFRPYSFYIVFYAATLAQKLGLPSISILEFGCAGGKGLLQLELISEEIEKYIDVKIEIYGFDTGVGLPKPLDYRDLPHQWQEGFFAMNQVKLYPKLKRSQLVIGDVKNTVPNFIETYNPPPIGAVIHDLDFYSSTKDSFNLFKNDPKYFLPRVFNYFDDIIGTEIESINDFTGERLAINEFNLENADRKFSIAYNLTCKANVLSWYNQIRILHFFSHLDYCNFIGDKNQQAPL